MSYVDPIFQQLCDSIAASARLYFIATNAWSVKDADKCKTHDVELVLRDGAEGHRYEGDFFCDVHFTFGVFRDCAGHGICEGECEEIDSSTFTVAMPDYDIAKMVFEHFQNCPDWMPGE